MGDGVTVKNVIPQHLEALLSKLEEMGVEMNVGSDLLKEDMEKFTTLPPVDDELFTDYLVLSGGIAREEAMCDWLKNCIRLCKSRSTL